MGVINWAGNVTFSAERLERPTSVEQLQHLVAGSTRIRALGTGHSFNRIADTDGVLVSVADLPARVAIDSTARTVEVSGGTRYGELGAALDAQGWALHNLGSLPHISVAGATATGTHGSGDGNACLAASVVAVEFVQGDGELVRVTRESPDFGGSVLALGALGVVTNLTLAIEPTYAIRQDVWLDAPLATVADHLDEIMAAGYSVSLFSHHRDGVIDQIWLKTRVGDEVADGRAWGARAADTPMHPIVGHHARAANDQLGRPGAWHERLPHFRLAYTPSSGAEQQSEWMVPREHGSAALRAVAALDLGPTLQVAEVRTVAADNLWLSPFHDRAGLALHFTWVDDDALVATAVERVEQALARFEPRPHWAKVFHTLVRPKRLDEFAALVARHDPDGRFGNAYLDRLLGP